MTEYNIVGNEVETPEEFYKIGDMFVLNDTLYILSIVDCHRDTTVHPLVTLVSIQTRSNRYAHPKPVSDTARISHAEMNTICSDHDLDSFNNFTKVKKVNISYEV